jgi:hypothetical protein
LNCLPVVRPGPYVGVVEVAALTAPPRRDRIRDPLAATVSTAVRCHFAEEESVVAK